MAAGGNSSIQNDVNVAPCISCAIGSYDLSNGLPWSYKYFNRYLFTAK